MAEEGGFSSAAPASQENVPTRGDESGRRGGRGGRGGLGGQDRRQNRGEGHARGDRERGGQRGRGRGRGRGDMQGQRGGSRTNGDGVGVTSPRSAAAQPLGGGSTVPSTRPEGDKPADEEEVEAEVCFICASPVVHNAVAPCNHRTCHICSLRLRALYKTKACAHCRTNAETVIFTDDAVKRFEDFQIADFSSRDENLGINYANPEIFEDTVLLLRYNCPDESCDVACLGWPDLHRHVRNVHHKAMCDLCTRNKKVFTHEHELFTPAELRRHEKYGDDNPGAVDQSGFKGHPECGFCKQRFYGDDELYAHCRDKHERCHVCDRRNEGRNPQYYLDYNALEVHFRKDHFLCPDQECLEKKFVVFDSEMDLKAHQLEAHPNGLTKDARRDARRVDISGFDYRAPHQQERPRREREREGRGRGRGRDPNAEPLPVSSAQPMRRDELAYQRAMAIQSAQSVTTRNFGGQLTQPAETYAARPPAGAAEPATVTAPRPSQHQNGMPALENLNLGPTPGGAASGTTTPSAPSGPLTPQEQARRLRHAAVTERASALLRNDAKRLEEFRSKVSAYRNGSVAAPSLIDGFFALFDTSATELGKLIKELAEIFEVPGKRDALLKAWGDWRAINEDYPSLPGPSGNPTTAAGVLGAGAGGSRVLKLKSSTAQSSRSAVSKHGSWGSASPNGAPFPALSASRGAPASRNAGAKTSTPWVSSASSTANSARPSPAPSRIASSANLAAPPRSGADMFPALPPGKKPTSSVFSPGYTGAGVRRPNSTTPAANPWASSSGLASPPALDEDLAADSEGSGVGGKKKGNKGKKQMLFQWG